MYGYISLHAIGHKNKRFQRSSSQPQCQIAVLRKRNLILQKRTVTNSLNYIRIQN